MRIRFTPLFGFMLVIFSCSAPQRAASLPVRFPLEVECSIFSPSGDLLWRAPYKVCHFLPDGTYIYSDDTSLHFIGADGKEIWQKPLHSHHMITLAGNGDFLVLSSEWLPVHAGKFKRFFEHNNETMSTKEYKGIPGAWKKMNFRRDKLIRINRSGEIVATRTFPNEFFSAGQLIHTSSQVPEKYKLEESHFNSFYEISPNASPLPAFRAGNFLINDTMNRIIFVLDKNLGKELWRISYERLGYKTAHDVTLLPNGNLLIFVNRQASGPPLSSIDEVSPADGRLISRRSEPGGFYARYCGSAQPREGGALLYAAEKNGKTMVKVLSAAGKLIFSLDLYPYFGRFVQGAYERRELEGFLSEAARP